MNQQNAGTERTQSGLGGSTSFSAKSHETAEQLKNNLVGQAEQMRQRADAAREQAAERIRRVASELRNVSTSLRGEDAIAATVAERASQGIESVAGYVSATDARAFVRDAELIARRQPAIFYGTAFLLGIAAGRFLRSSRPDDGWSAGQNTHGNRVERPSGFYSPREDYRSSTSQQRFRENYDAAFGRDTEDFGAGRNYGSGTGGPGTGTSSSNYGSSNYGSGIRTETGTEGNNATYSNGTTTQSDNGVSGASKPEKGSST